MAVAAARHASASVIRVEPDGHSLLPSGPYIYLSARTKEALAVCEAVVLRRMREYAQHVQCGSGEAGERAEAHTSAAIRAVASSHRWKLPKCSSHGIRLMQS